MPPKLKRGPPYDDDPGCKYIVIEDPWPGNVTGKDRNQRFYNFLCAWVYFMLGKQHEVECVFAVNTRNEVIVQLSQDVDIVPILGAHPWRKVLTGGDTRDINRVSYVFAYDYRKNGEPAKHNWQEIYPTVSGDPPAHLHFPVKFPYPHVSWASPRGKNCADIALPLPPMRQPTPVPDTSLFAPYQHPSQLTSTTVNNAEARREAELQAEQRQRPQGPPPNSVGKAEPYDEGPRPQSQSLRQSSTADSQPRIKTESHDAPVKQEPAPYEPSSAFRSAFEELQRARATNALTVDRSQPPSEHSTTNGNMRPKTEYDDPDSGPSESFVAAFNEIRRGLRGPSESPQISGGAPTAKPDPDLPPPPSESFMAAFASIRGTHTDGQRSPPAPARPTENVTTQRAAATRADNGHTSIKLENDVRQNSEPRAAMQAKRVKQEDHADGPSKRFKREG